MSLQESRRGSSCFLFPVSCFLFPVSCFLFPVSCFPSDPFRILQLTLTPFFFIFFQSEDDTSLLAGIINSDPIYPVVGGVIGGTASELGGGKFANGAITGAFSRLFNDIAFQQQLERRKYHIRLGIHASQLAENISTIVTDGKGGIRPHIAPVEQNPIVIAGITANENVHINQVEEYAANLHILDGARDGLTIVWTDVPITMQKVFERQSFSAHLQYYRNVLKQGDLLPEEEFDIEARIRGINNAIERK